jgi:hypothetical protein
LSQGFQIALSRASLRLDQAVPDKAYSQAHEHQAEVVHIQAPFVLEKVTVLDFSQQPISGLHAAGVLTFPSPYSTHLAKFLSVINALDRYSISIYRFQFKR